MRRLLQSIALAFSAAFTRVGVAAPSLPEAVQERVDIPLEDLCGPVELDEVWMAKMNGTIELNERDRKTVAASYAAFCAAMPTVIRRKLTISPVGGRRL